MLASCQNSWFMEASTGLLMHSQMWFLCLPIHRGLLPSKLVENLQHICFQKLSQNMMI